MRRRTQMAYHRVIRTRNGVHFVSEFFGKFQSRGLRRVRRPVVYAQFVQVQLRSAVYGKRKLRAVERKQIGVLFAHCCGGHVKAVVGVKAVYANSPKHAIVVFVHSEIYPAVGFGRYARKYLSAPVSVGQYRAAYLYLPLRRSRHGQYHGFVQVRHGLREIRRSRSEIHASFAHRARKHKVVFVLIDQFSVRHIFAPLLFASLVVGMSFLEFFVFRLFGRRFVVAVVIRRIDFHIGFLSVDYKVTVVAHGYANLGFARRKAKHKHKREQKRGYHCKKFLHQKPSA